MHSPLTFLKDLPFFFLLVAFAALTGLTACGEKKKTAAELNAEKAAKFKKQQKIEAIKAYTDLVNKYPDSEHVAEAKERLKVLGPMLATPSPTPKPKK